MLIDYDSTVCVSVADAESPEEEDGTRCGGGLQRRTSTCVDRFRRVMLPDSACTLLPPPTSVQRCEVPPLHKPLHNP